MTFKANEVHKFCMEMKLYSPKDRAKAFDMGVMGYFCAMFTHPCKLGRETILYIRETYGLKILKRLVEKEQTETWPSNKKVPKLA